MGTCVVGRGSATPRAMPGAHRTLLDTLVLLGTSPLPFALLQGKGRKKKSKESKIIPMGTEIGKTPKMLSLAPRRGRANREGLWSPPHLPALPNSCPFLSPDGKTSLLLCI